ncbi:hypothetical protein [Nostoc sp. NMS9]|uniref:hypothetical protein n=1 Tax=Nostoc sp. NMS9 TaxID=2815393 RepID=UPI0025E3BA12|nr:hypothetical protein [Nostoc sp. NMS9]MBN3940757.1 hypothetical protein [Nostoc sp. NMS9]
MTKTSNIPEPDPAWDYYLTYHKLLKAKAQLNQLIDDIGELELATAGSNESINEDLFDLVQLLDDTRLPVELPICNEE